MPLFLQLVSKHAGIGSLVSLVAWLLRYTVSAIANAIGMPCRSACSIQRQVYLTSQPAQAGLPDQKTQRTDNGMRTCVQSRSRFVKLLCVAHQPPDAVRHLRGPPESRPQPGSNIAVSCSSEQCLNCIPMLQELSQHTCYNGRCLGASLSLHSTEAWCEQTTEQSLPDIVDVCDQKACQRRNCSVCRSSSRSGELGLAAAGRCRNAN